MTRPQKPAPLSLSALFLIFARIGLTSFGGGLSGWLMREFVVQRRLMSQDDFLSGLALSQALPGINVVNLSIWIGYRLQAGRGALVATLGMVVPPLLLAILMLIGLEQLTGSTLVPQIMAGIAAAAIGLSLEMGVRSARRAANGLIPITLMVAVFAGIFVMEWNLIPVILICAPLSIWHAWLQQGQSQADPS
ncbi:MAG: chromate transporter [Alcaligenes sp.]